MSQSFQANGQIGNKNVIIYRGITQQVPYDDAFVQQGTEGVWNKILQC